VKRVTGIKNLILAKDAVLKLKTRKGTIEIMDVSDAKDVVIKRY